MAEIVAKFNTKEKTLSCTVDGKAVADVAEVYMTRGYSGDGKYGCGLTTRTDNEEEGTTHVTRLIASEQGELIDVVSEVKSDILKYFGVEEG